MVERVDSIPHISNHCFPHFQHKVVIVVFKNMAVYVTVFKIILKYCMY